MTQRLRFAVLMLLLLAAATSLMATPDQEMFIEYYTDDTYMTQCGWMWVRCTGISRGGCLTMYSIEYPLGPC